MDLLYLISLKKWNDVVQRLNTHEGQVEATQINQVLEREQYPIHEACQHEDLPLQVAYALIEAFPDGMKHRDKSGRLPIHYVSHYNPSIDVLKLFIDKYPKGLEQVDYDEQSLPIHESIYKKRPVEYIKVLVDHFPDGLKQPKNGGWLPIHFAALHPSVEVMKLMIGGYREGVQQSCPDGRLPIHWASKETDSVDVIKLLNETYPEGAEQADHFGKLPGDYASERKSLITEGRAALLHRFNQHDKEVPRVSQTYLETCSTKEIGKGGNGTVYLASDKHANIVFVIKRYHKKKQAMNEIRILSKFQHPYLVRLYATSKYKKANKWKESEFCLLLEHLSKGSLENILDDQGERNELSFSRRIKISSDVTSALCYLHNFDNNNNSTNDTSKCYHRDVKSANICLDDNWTAKLIDCGISKEADGDATHATSTNNVSVGTAGYTAPEYAMSRQHYNEKCEVFSLGIVFVELITGEKTTSMSTDSHYKMFSEKKTKKLYPDNLDKRILEDMQNDSTIVKFVEKFCNLALRCIDEEPDRRPSLKVIQRKLYEYLNVDGTSTSSGSNNDITSSLKQDEDEYIALDQCCKICYFNEGDLFTACNSSYLCRWHFFEHVVTNLEAKEIPCVCNDVCGKHFTDQHISRASEKLLGICKKARDDAQNRLKQSSLEFLILELKEQQNQILCNTEQINHTTQQLHTNVNVVNERTRDIGHKIDALSTKFDLVATHLLKGMLSVGYSSVPCPRLFVIIPKSSRPFQPSYRGWKLLTAKTQNFKTWCDKLVHKTWHLYFICAHDRQPVYPPIQIKSPRDWVQKIAPALKVVLLIIQLTVKATTSLDFNLSSFPNGLNDPDQLQGMIQVTDSFLNAEAKQLINAQASKWAEEGKQGQQLDQYEKDQLKNFEKLTHDACKCVEEKVKNNDDWKKNMTLVSSKDGLVWVRNEHANLVEYEPIKL